MAARHNINQIVYLLKGKHSMRWSILLGGGIVVVGLVVAVVVGFEVEDGLDVGADCVVVGVSVTGVAVAGASGAVNAIGTAIAVTMMAINATPISALAQIGADLI